MPTYTYAFSGGVDAVQGWGDRWNIVFGGSFALGDYWTIENTSTQGDFTIGAGRLSSLNYALSSAITQSAFCLTYRDRVYAGLGSRLNFSDNGDPTEWQEQGPGAGFIDYLSQFGSQDQIYSLGQLQGRLAVFGRRSIQVFQVDADPNLFQLVQTLDNAGTRFHFSVQQIGELDLLYVDDTGVRSLKTLETTLNAYVDDVGSPIDTILQPILPTITPTFANPGVVTIVEPLTKNAWFFIKDTIYVYSSHPAAKISAWSKFTPMGNDAALFVPVKFVVYNGNVYCRSFTRGHYIYGATNGRVYDADSEVTFTTPYMDDKKPGTNKTFIGVDATMAGNWTIAVSADAESNNFVNALINGSTTSPDVTKDSTYDQGRNCIDLQGSHFAIKCTSANVSTTKPAVFSTLILYYNLSEIP